MAHLITKLTNRYSGPILVIGGGPSVLEDFKRLPKDFKPDCVISANGHGFKQDRFKVDYIACMDHKHSETKEFMQDLMSVHGVPIITRHWWGDYRIPTRPVNFRLNSGFTAVALAAMFGGNPVIATGLDCYTGGTYFHNKDVLTCQSSVAWPRFTRQIIRLERMLAGANIRPMSGPLTDTFPAYDPEETFEKPERINIVEQFKNVKEYQARTATAFHWTFADLPANAQFPVSEKEGLHMLHNQGRYPIFVMGLDT